MDNERLLGPLSPVSSTTSEIKLLNLTGGLCSEPTECRTTADKERWTVRL